MTAKGGICKVTILILISNPKSLWYSWICSVQYPIRICQRQNLVKHQKQNYKIKVAENAKLFIIIQHHKLKDLKGCMSRLAWKTKLWPLCFQISKNYGHFDRKGYHYFISLLVYLSIIACTSFFFNDRFILRLVPKSKPWNPRGGGGRWGRRKRKKVEKERRMFSKVQSQIWKMAETDRSDSESHHD